MSKYEIGLFVKLLYKSAKMPGVYRVVNVSGYFGSCIIHVEPVFAPTEPYESYHFDYYVAPITPYEALVYKTIGKFPDED